MFTAGIKNRPWKKQNNAKITLYPISARCQSAGVCTRIHLIFQWSMAISNEHTAIPEKLYAHWSAYFKAWYIDWIFRSEGRSASRISCRVDLPEP